MKAALVTGAGKRIGSALAKCLGQAGYAVALHYKSSAEGAEALAGEIGGTTTLIEADLSDLSAAPRVIDRAYEAFGRLDLLVNSAAMFEYDTLDSLTEESWRAHIDTNLAAPIFLTKAYAARLSANETGLVVNMLDQKVFRPNPDYFAYTAAKVGLAHMTPALALALAPRIRVAGIAPGVTLPSGKQTDDDYERAAAATPSGVSSTVEDLARALTFIIDTASFSGQVLTIDGGESLLGRPRDVAYDTSV